MNLVYSAVNNNDLQQLQEVLLEHPELDVNLPLIGSMTALHVAAEKGYSYCVMVLMSAGADVNITDEFGYTPLMNGIIAGYPLVVKKLLTGSCSIDQVSHHGLTALHMAVKKGSLHIVNMLLRAGARPSLQTRDNLSALAIAVQNRDTAVIKALLLGCRYIDPNMLISKSESPFYNALSTNEFELAKILVLSGYGAKSEMHQYLNHLEAEQRALQVQSRRIFPFHLHHREVISVRSQHLKDSLTAILPLTLQPLRLQDLCRLRIRKQLSFSIFQKVTAMRLPRVIQDYICFRDIYEEPSEDTNAE